MDAPNFHSTYAPVRKQLIEFWCVLAYSIIIQYKSHASFATMFKFEALLDNFDIFLMS